MSKLYPPIILFSTGKEMSVSGYQLPEPQSNTYPGGYRKGRENGYQSDYKKWQDSKVIVKVQEESKTEIKEYACEWFRNTYGDRFKDKYGDLNVLAANNRYNELLASGIDISSLADRLEYYQISAPLLMSHPPQLRYSDWFVRLLSEEQTETAICPTCGIERKVSVDKEGSGCFLSAGQTEIVKEDQDELWNDIIGEIDKPVGLAVLSRLKSKYSITRK